jgi:hypothetical protein
MHTLSSTQVTQASRIRQMQYVFFITKRFQKVSANNKYFMRKVGNV